jgi:hypothetical protein
LLFPADAPTHTLRATLLRCAHTPTERCVMRSPQTLSF